MAAKIRFTVTPLLAQGEPVSFALVETKPAARVVKFEPVLSSGEMLPRQFQAFQIL